MGRKLVANVVVFIVIVVGEMTSPVSKRTEPRTMYGEKVGSDVCGVGVYSNE